MMGYEEIKKALLEMPKTFIPAILTELIGRAKEEKVFEPNDGILEFVRMIEKDLVKKGRQ